MGVRKILKLSKVFGIQLIIILGHQTIFPVSERDLNDYCSVNHMICCAVLHYNIMYSLCVYNLLLLL